MIKQPNLADYNLDKSKIEFYEAFYKKIESYSSRMSYSLIIILAVYLDYKGYIQVTNATGLIFVSC